MNVDDHALRLMIRDLDQAVDEGTMPPLALDDLRAARARVASALDRIEGRKVQKPTKDQIEMTLARDPRIGASLSLSVRLAGTHFEITNRWPSPSITELETLRAAEGVLTAAGFDAYRVGARVEVRA